MAKFNYSIYADGACSPNPGKGGYGVLIINNDTGDCEKYVEGFDNTTNNRMEMRAIICALSRLPIGASAMIYTDSEHCVNGLTGKNARKKNLDLWALLDQILTQFPHIEFQWVKGHAKNEYNNVVDDLAVKARKGYFGELHKDIGYVAK